MQHKRNLQHILTTTKQSPRTDIATTTGTYDKKREGIYDRKREGISDKKR